MEFSLLGLAEPLLKAIASEGYTVATPIQAQAIPHILAGRDVLGAAQTGTGKTAAFALPILHRLSQNPRTPGAKSRCLVLCPTRELATQTAEAFRVYGKNLKLRQTVIFGGVGQNPQAYAIRQGVDIIVATPGRLLDLINQGLAPLSSIEMLVLDEADRMLDMGFINDIRKIAARIPAARQTLLFSATMPREIRTLATALLRDPVNVEVTPVYSTTKLIDERLYFVSRNDKPALLAKLFDELPMSRSIVFTRTKRGADRVVKRLQAEGIRAEAIHGDKTQSARERALNNFRANKTPMLIATDIASRGIDIDGVTHVVNYDLTHEPETYVHRIGRTARAGASGMAVSFCDVEEVPNLRAIEKLIRRPIPVVEKHELASQEAAAQAAPRSHDRRPSNGSGHGGSRDRSPAHASHQRSNDRPATRQSDRPSAPRRNEASAGQAAPHLVAGRGVKRVAHPVLGRTYHPPKRQAAHVQKHTRNENAGRPASSGGAHR